MKKFDSAINDTRRVLDILIHAAKEFEAGPGKNTGLQTINGMVFKLLDSGHPEQSPWQISRREVDRALMMRTRAEQALPALERAFLSALGDRSDLIEEYKKLRGMFKDARVEREGERFVFRDTRDEEAFQILHEHLSEQLDTDNQRRLERVIDACTATFRSREAIEKLRTGNANTAEMEMKIYLPPGFQMPMVRGLKGKPGNGRAGLAAAIISHDLKWPRGEIVHSNGSFGIEEGEDKKGSFFSIRWDTSKAELPNAVWLEAAKDKLEAAMREAVAGFEFTVDNKGNPLVRGKGHALMLAHDLIAMASEMGMAGAVRMLRGSTPIPDEEVGTATIILQAAIDQKAIKAPDAFAASTVRADKGNQSLYVGVMGEKAIQKILEGYLLKGLGVTIDGRNPSPKKHDI